MCWYFRISVFWYFLCTLFLLTLFFLKSHRIILGRWRPPESIIFVTQPGRNTLSHAVAIVVAVLLLLPAVALVVVAR